MCIALTTKCQKELESRYRRRMEQEEEEEEAAAAAVEAEKNTASLFRIIRNRRTAN